MQATAIRRHAFIVKLSQISPRTFSRLREPFDHPDWIFGLKHDGFRVLAYIADGACELVSRRTQHPVSMLKERGNGASRSETGRGVEWYMIFCGASDARRDQRRVESHAGTFKNRNGKL